MTNPSAQVERYILSGVAALHIEDQVQTKRCGHLQGKELVDVPTFLSRIRAAAAARERLGSDIVLIARTDALAELGFNEAVGRLKAAVKAGADVVFLEGMKSVEEMRRVVEVMVCFSPFSLSPFPSSLPRPRSPVHSPPFRSSEPFPLPPSSVYPLTI